MKPQGEALSLDEMRTVRIIAGLVAAALSAIPFAWLAVHVIDWAWNSPRFARVTAEQFESPSWAVLTAFIWAAVGFMGTLIGALPALIITHSKAWTRRAKGSAVVASGMGAAMAVCLLYTHENLETLAVWFAPTAVAAALMSATLWLIGRGPSR